MGSAEEVENTYLSDRFVSKTQASRAIAQTGTSKSEINPADRTWTFGVNTNKVQTIFFLWRLGLNLSSPLPETTVFIGVFYWESAASHNVSCTTVRGKLHLEMTSAQLSIWKPVCCNSLQLQYGCLAECQSDFQRHKPAVALWKECSFSLGVKDGGLRGLPYLLSTK